MLKHIEKQVEASLRAGAYEDFMRDFGSLGNRIEGVFEAVRIKLGYETGSGTAIDNVYSAAGEALAQVGAMIKTGNAPPERDTTGAIITINRSVIHMANSYMRLAEEGFAARLVESTVRLGMLSTEADMAEADRPQREAESEATEEPEPEAEVVFVRNPAVEVYATEDPEVWERFVSWFKCGFLSVRPLDLKCPTCQFETEGAFVGRQGVPVMPWRCRRPTCHFSSEVTVHLLGAADFTEDQVYRPVVTLLEGSEEEVSETVDDLADVETVEARIFDGLKSRLWVGKFIAEAHAAVIGAFDRIGILLEALPFAICPECDWPVEGYQLMTGNGPRRRWVCTNERCVHGTEIQVENVEIDKTPGHKCPACSLPLDAADHCANCGKTYTIM